MLMVWTGTQWASGLLSIVGGALVASVAMQEHGVLIAGSYSEGNPTSGVFVDALGLHLGDSGNDPLIYAAASDPSSGGGYAAEVSSLLLVNISDMATVWQKTGSADTAWTQIAPVVTPPITAQVLVSDPNGAAISTGDGKAYLTVPAAWNGKTVQSIHAGLTTASSSGTPTIQVARIRGGSPVDVLSTKVTIDANELTSYTAATPPVVDTANDDLSTGDLLRVDVDVAGTGAKGLMVLIGIG